NKIPGIAGGEDAGQWIEAGFLFVTSVGDGSMVHLSRDEIDADVRSGTEDGAKRAKVDPLRDDELAHLVDIFASPARFSAVDIGDEVVLHARRPPVPSCDVPTLRPPGGHPHF
ncbi:MAG: hypothetical protein HGB35_05540, partial [Geobacteraceae bacterium]|nr:hypothetical protein [Geobacteraceae bacterium]